MQKAGPHFAYISGLVFFWFQVFFLLFNDNLATGGSLTGAFLSCHVEVSKYNNARRIKNQTEMHKRMHCIAIASNAALQECINSIEFSI